MFYSQNVKRMKVTPERMLYSEIFIYQQESADISVFSEWYFDGLYVTGLIVECLSVIDSDYCSH